MEETEFGKSEENVVEDSVFNNVRRAEQLITELNKIFSTLAGQGVQVDADLHQTTINAFGDSRYPRELVELKVEFMKRL